MHKRSKILWAAMVGLLLAMFVVTGCGKTTKETTASKNGKSDEVPISQLMLVERATTQVKEQGADLVAKLAGEIDLQENGGEVTGEGRSTLNVEGDIPNGMKLSGSGTNSFKKVKGTFKDGKLNLTIGSSAFWGGVSLVGKDGTPHLLSGFDEFPPATITLDAKDKATTTVKWQKWEITYTIRRLK